jgi:hypothetical protein
VRQGLVEQYGAYAAEAKLQNFLDIGPKPLSIVAFHNVFTSQIRDAFVVGAYYPSLVSACALGERILNYLILVLRKHYRKTPEYKRVYRKDSFDDWDVPISVLKSWDVLLPEATAGFEALQTLRNRAIHFDPSTDRNDRTLALEAIQLLTKIITAQFGWLGTQRWFIPDMRGASYIKREAEENPFIHEIYVPNCAYVGPKHRSERIVNGQMIISDEESYEDRQITDDEFRNLLFGVT